MELAKSDMNLEKETQIQLEMNAQAATPAAFVKQS